jgi:tetratricopeptide (TPR) repeat protein
MDSHDKRPTLLESHAVEQSGLANERMAQLRARGIPTRSFLTISSSGQAWSAPELKVFVPSADVEKARAVLPEAPARKEPPVPRWRDEELLDDEELSDKEYWDRRDARKMRRYWIALVVLVIGVPSLFLLMDSTRPARPADPEREARGEWVGNMFGGEAALKREQYEEAERYFRSAVSRAEQFHLGERELGDAKLGLGRALMLRNQLEEAETVLREALAAHTVAFGPEHVWVANDYAVLGRALYLREEYAKSTVELERAAAIYEKVPGARVKLAETLDVLGLDYVLLDAPEKARPLMERALKLYEDTRGPTHPDTSLLRVRLGGVCFQLKDDARAREHLEQAIPLVEQHSGLEAPGMSYALTALADIYDRQGAHERALPLIQRALPLQRVLLGEEHPETVWSLYLLARVHTTPRDVPRRRRPCSSAWRGCTSERPMPPICHSRGCSTPTPRSSGSSNARRKRGRWRPGAASSSPRRSPEAGGARCSRPQPISFRASSSNSRGMESPRTLLNSRLASSRRPSSARAMARQTLGVSHAGRSSRLARYSATASSMRPRRTSSLPLSRWRDARWGDASPGRSRRSSSAFSSTVASR